MVIVWVMGKAFRMLNLPVLFGELLGGIIVGPLVLGIVDPDLDVLKECNVARCKGILAEMIGSDCAITRIYGIEGTHNQGKREGETDDCEHSAFLLPDPISQFRNVGNGDHGKGAPIACKCV